MRTCRNEGKGKGHRGDELQVMVGERIAVDWYNNVCDLKRQERSESGKTDIKILEEGV